MKNCKRYALFLIIAMLIVTSSVAFSASAIDNVSSVKGYASPTVGTAGETSYFFSTSLLSANTNRNIEVWIQFTNEFNQWPSLTDQNMNKPMLTLDNKYYHLEQVFTRSGERRARMYLAQNGNICSPYFGENGFTVKQGFVPAKPTTNQPALPSGITAVVQFPVDGTGWYNASGSPYHKQGKGYRAFGGVGADDTWAVDLNLSGNRDNGASVKAVADGEVVLVDKNYGYVLIKHTNQLQLTNGDETLNTWYSGYMHMRNITVKKGSGCSVGDSIGTVSNTSPQAVSAHLHFAIYGSDGITSINLRRINTFVDSYADR